MKIPYPRPTKLSDPHFDFTPDLLEQLLAVPDEKLECQHLVNLLGPFLPAGTYQESAYFLPFALKSLPTEERAADLTTSVCWFISQYANNLARDGLLDECRSQIDGCLRHWVANFTVKHFNRDACAAKGWKFNYFDFVNYHEFVCATLSELDRFTRHADLADRFITQLALSPEPVNSGWFLELARAQDDISHPPAREVFQRYFSDKRLLERKAAIVREHLAATTTSPTYWRDVFSKLGL